MKSLKELRECAQLTQTEVSRELGIGQSAISQWETGGTAPQAKQLLKLALLYRCAADEILTAVSPKKRVKGVHHGR